MIVKRKKDVKIPRHVYQLVYFLIQGDQEVEIGRVSWSDRYKLLGANNDYEDGLLAGLKALCSEDVDLIVE